MTNYDFIQFASPGEKAQKVKSGVKGAGRGVRGFVERECHAKSEFKYFQGKCESFNEEFKGMSGDERRTTKAKAQIDCKAFKSNIRDVNPQGDPVGQGKTLPVCAWTRKRPV